MEYMQYFPGNHSDLPGIADFLSGLDSSIKYRAVIACDDNLAIGAVKYARKKGLSIPDDLSIIGYNNSLLSTCCEPELTSVDNRLQTLCHHIVKTLIGILNGKEMPQKVIFSGELIKRGTTL
jgi:LacI family transcriptional regulator/LacI family asc operon transcriptional repressor